MVKIGNILKRSWQILWNYRVLWIFGFLLALTTGGRGGGNGGGGSSSGGRGEPSGDFKGFEGFHGQLPADSPQWLKDMAEWFTNNIVPLFIHPEQHVSTFVTIGLVILLIIIVLGLLAALVRYPSETAVIRMVDDFETTGIKAGFKAGWGMGWNRRAFRLWLIDLILSLPVLLVLLILGGAAVIIMASTVGGTSSMNVAGMVGGIGLLFLTIFLLLVVAVFLGLLRNFFARKAAIEGLGVGESIRQGWAMFKRNWKSAGLVWLVMVGIGIAFGIASFILFFLLIPVFLLLILPAGLVAAIPGGIAYLISSLFVAGPWSWIIAGLIALPFFGLILGAPLTLVEGMYRVYEANVWTLTYREINTLEDLSASEQPSTASELPQ
ncbi:hypothetical protein hrd7_14400 [Leptolinea sp. HRD-7]|nr:hypothetical protein hrd7_14400 [Leptolinea sp. HRD-7]